MKGLYIVILSFEIFIFENGLCKDEEEVKELCNYDFSTIHNVYNGASKPKKGKSSCDKRVLIKWLSHMGVANPEDVGLLPSSTRNIDVLCSRIEEALKRMVPVATNCGIDEELKYFRTLLVGMDALSSMFCNDTSFRDDYLKNADCLNRLYWDLEDCEGSAQWICSTNKTFVCETYRWLQTCIFLKSGVLCGWTGASVMNVAVREATDNMLREKCKNVQCDPAIPNDVIFAKLGGSPLYVVPQSTFFGALVSVLFCFINRV